MNTHSLHRSALIAIMSLVFMAMVPAWALAPLVEVTLEPRQITLGESAQLTITSTGMGMEALSLPNVSGLEFRVVGNSRRLEMINGATLSTTSIVIRVSAQVAGIFTIPGITPKSQPLVLRVNPDNGGAGSPSNGGYNSTPRPPIIPGGSTVSGIRLTADGAAFIRLELPKRDVYVGESIPVDIEVGMRSGVVTSLNGLPTLTGSEFTLNNLSQKPDRVEKLIDGKPFTVITWHSVIAPVKPGVFTLSVDAPLTVRVKTQPQRYSMIDDMLGDPFLQNFFATTVPKEIKISSPTTDLKVLALPTDGRPTDFSGAVGTFKIASDISSTTAAAGDPLTLRLHVSGTGNFDRVDTPMLERAETWRTYPPKSSFAPGDPTGYKGEKTFEQPLIASHPGAQTVPGLAFSYFDPTTRKYETAHSAPLAVNISPALADSNPNTPHAPATDLTSATDANARQAAEKASAGLRPDHSVTGTAVSSLRPLYMQREFLVAPSLLALAFAGAWLTLNRRAAARREPKPRERVTSKAANQVLKQMQAAAAAGQSTVFINTACAALRQRLDERPAGNQDASAPNDVDDRSSTHNANDVRQLFALADEINYSGDALTTTDYERWTRIVRHALSDVSPG